MGSAGMLQRPLTAMAAVAASAVSANLPDKLPHPKSSDPGFLSEKSHINCSAMLHESKSWVSQISASKLTDLSFATRFKIPVPNIKNMVPSSSLSSNHCSLSTASPSVLRTLYQSAEIAKPPKPSEFTQSAISKTPSEVMYRWHLPESKVYKDLEESDCSSAKSRTVVVLLGWLGAKQKHLQRYADWYTSRGFHAITFTFPMSEILSYQVGGKTEQHIDLLVNHLAGWLEEEHGKNLVFHTFSNTGWLTYGVILEKFHKQDESLMGRIKGCVVDSAPVAAPDPRVWASGFSTAFLKKQSVGTKGSIDLNGSNGEVTVSTTVKAKPAVTETALLVILEKFFEVVLNLPTVSR
ncbi:hypothetical protein GIB67_003545 [Kingdonia uniflora]|uniref:Uncharacterized protein n=1 Tax=Kingdonia uniflora TaxID=39325 RepID=A0A7J7MEN6_9MAGN|nr:hypothetical protein GIB67_003545 [Kingdonia uniflora]